jgi:hypothetical protein
LTRAPVTPEIALLGDGALVLRVEPGVRAAVLPWVPRGRSPRSETITPRATLSVEQADVDDSAAQLAFTKRQPTLVLGGVSAYIERDDVWVHGASPISGRANLARREARVAIDSAATPPAPVNAVHGALTLLSALLLGRIDRALVHAAAVVDAGGRGWLLVGDTHSGKTTTCATLVAAGWRYVADDQVVLDASPSGLEAEGWPRDAHLDRGWSSGRVTRTRTAADLSTIRADAWQDRVRVHGAWFTSVDADRPTAARRIAPADALGRLIRQSPWLLADSATAASGLALLSRVAAMPCAAVSLGRDSYADGGRLVRCLESDIGLG